MHHTLIPTEERHALRREYRIRVLIVLFFAASIACLIGIGAQFPAFFRAATESREATAALATVQESQKQTGFTGIEAAVKAYAPMLAAAAPTVSTPDSALIESVVQARGPVMITSISVSDLDKSRSISIIGIAPTRDELIAFKARLASAFSSAKVDYPISVLAASTDVRFNMTVTGILP
ncbi:hypothetical protein KGP36_05315 [Patescibacteria group bacterium]|nr:hypothetical protein [Patescibacteria group bacterium]MDE1940512.1 hypothetical protein [Patescibacteria group bacterium]